jgi:hypothetical protein
LGSMADTVCQTATEYRMKIYVFSFHFGWWISSPLCTLVGEGSTLLTSSFLLAYFSKVFLGSSADFQYENHAYGRGGSL